MGPVEVPRVDGARTRVCCSPSRICNLQILPGSLAPSTQSLRALHDLWSPDPKGPSQADSAVYHPNFELKTRGLHCLLQTKLSTMYTVGF